MTTVDWFSWVLIVLGCSEFFFFLGHKCQRRDDRRERIRGNHTTLTVSNASGFEKGMVIEITDGRTKQRAKIK